MLRRISCWIALWPCLVVAQDDALPAYILLLPNSVQTVLIAETDTAILHRYRADASGLVAEDEQRMSIGQNGVGKRTSGDRRTPLGIFYITEELDTRNIHEKYGPVAFPLDYPTAWDALNGRTGSGIWIHGVAPGSGLRPVRDTDGCIALPNAQLLELRHHLTPSRTPVIVTRRIRHASGVQIAQARDRLLTALKSWTASYRDGDWYQFVSLYADEFSYRGMSRDEWIVFRLESAGNRPLTTFVIDEITLLADPEEPGLYVSRFRQKSAEADRSITITKRLYWRADSAGELKIVAEDNG